MSSKTSHITQSALWQFVFVVAVILGFRIMFVDVYDKLQERMQLKDVDYLSLLFSNTWAIIISFFVDFFVASFINKRISIVEHSVRHFWLDLLAVMVVSLLGLVPVYLREWIQAPTDVNQFWHMVFSYLTLVLLNLVFISLLELLFFYRKSRSLIRAEQDKVQQSQYKYGLLKQQLNPHFLFNSLNILDYLVQSGEKEHASLFIHKLASVYRYFLNVEQNDTIDLHSECEFVRLYCDLLQERFQEGLKVEIDIPEEYSRCWVVPFSLQVLVENAVKHNVVNKEHPLYIKIGIDNDSLFVINNVQPRLSSTSSGVGQSNIEQQYHILTGKNITILHDDDFYTVRLPFIYKQNV